MAEYGGVQGYNSTSHAPAMLEMLGMPYVGHDPLNATTLDNKHAFKREAVCAGLPTAPFMTWHMSRGPSGRTVIAASNRHSATTAAPSS